MSFEILICPKCENQVEESYEDGLCCTRCYGVYVVRVPFDPNHPEEFRAKRDSLLDLERFKLGQIEREAAFRLAEQRWYENLSAADRFWEGSRRRRVREEVERLATPFERSLMELARWQIEDLEHLEHQLNRQVPLLDLLGRGPDPDALDVWLTGERPVPEVAEALGLS